NNVNNAAHSLVGLSIIHIQNRYFYAIAAHFILGNCKLIAKITFSISTAMAILICNLKPAI
ncbi:MAG: hypothetical protein KA133_03605, partial [Flavobacterium sp.]|nr:hypothetical protein [Flavobacterium sp.]